MGKKNESTLTRKDFWNAVLGTIGAGVVSVVGFGFFIGHKTGEITTTIDEFRKATDSKFDDVKEDFGKVETSLAELRSELQEHRDRLIRIETIIQSGKLTNANRIGDSNSFRWTMTTVVPPESLVSSSLDIQPSPNPLLNGITGSVELADSGTACIMTLKGDLSEDVILALDEGIPAKSIFLVREGNKE